MSDDAEIPTSTTASADGGADDQAQVTSSEPAEASGKPSDGTDTGGQAELSTKSAIDELFSELTGDDPADEKRDAKATTTTPEDDGHDDADPAATQGEDQKPSDTPEQVTDQKTKPQEPARARIRNLEKERDSHLGAFKVLNEGFEKAGLNPAKALDELGTLAKAKSGDPAARAEIARRYGLAEQTQAAPQGLDLEKLAALVEDANLDGIAELVTSAREAAKPKAPATPTPAKPADTTTTQDAPSPEIVATGRTHLEAIAAGVQAANPAQAPAILAKAATVMHQLVQERTEEGVTVTPSMWGALFRKAVGRATAEISKAEKPGMATRGGLRPTSAGGGGPKVADAIDEAFPGTF